MMTLSALGFGRIRERLIGVQYVVEFEAMGNQLPGVDLVGLQDAPAGIGVLTSLSTSRVVMVMLRFQRFSR